MPINHKGIYESPLYPIGGSHYIFVVVSTIHPSELDDTLRVQKNEPYDLLLLPEALKNTEYNPVNFQSNEVCFYNSPLPVHSELK